MSTTKQLAEAYKNSKYQVPGHGPRNIRVLRNALAELDGNLESDIYGKGQVIEEFEKKLAAILGKETAVFFPSGTMAQQIALRIWCDQKSVKKVAYHPLSHLEIHEEDGLKKLHLIESILLADKTRLIRMEDVKNMDTDVACLLLELPQREIGGELPEYEELVAISEYCREKEIKLQLDGARLFEVLPYYQKTAAEICQLFDSIYVSFYKGIGGLAGSILAGDEGFTKEAKVWKRRHGGDLISLYPYILSADYYFEQRKNRFPQYYEQAKELASFYNGCHGITTRPVVPVSNMFHVHLPFPKETLEPVFQAVYEEVEVGLAMALHAVDEGSCYFEVSVGDNYGGIPKEALQHAFRVLDEKMKEV
ncbi:beta-eliminating lyase-related protein [Brevibacillus choshinensis]|uniref:threonine aldolase family protein n=1 Tax=Brevibacillus choshinensis TaxID=54911 RepID=UPI002E1F1D03|nr:beta-eliminating lyase-related protein [Brevibacillus choshinensis]MED4581955.1 beta-eliminating lyase-related protein [Brevibacillus choshinensis]